MAGAPNAVTARIQAQVTTSSTSYVDITTTHGVLFGSRLKPSTTYLLVARGVVANQTAATGARVRLTRGGTAVPGSEQQFAIPVGRSRDYMFIQVYTTAGTPGDIKWQAMSSAGGSVTYLNEASLTCIELTGQTYQYNEDDDTGSPVLLTGGGATDTFASVTLSGQAGDWLVVSQIALDGGIADTGNQVSSILDKTAPSATTRTTLNRKTAVTIPSSVRGWVGNRDGTSTTFSAKVTEPGSGGVRWSHRFSNVFALKLDDIAGQSKFASPSDFSQTTASTWQQVSQVTLTNPSSTRYVVLGGANVDVNSSYNYYSRVQKDWTSGTDFTKTLHPEYDMSSTLKEHYPVQTTDRMMVAHGGVLVTRAGVSATVTHTGITTSSGAFPTTWRNPWLVAFPVNVGSGLVSPVAATDDGYSRSSLYSNSGATLYVGKVGSQNTGSWMRFPAMPVEQGSVVTGATLFVSKNLATDTTSGSPSALIRGEKAVNPSHPTTDADRLARTRTTASKVFDSGVWAGVAVGGYAGFDVKAIIQEIVDQESFAWGNAIQLFLDDNGSPSSTSWYAGQAREGGPLWPTLEVLVARVVPLGPTKGNKAKKGGGKATVLVKGRGSGRVAVTGLGVLSVEGGVPDSDSGVLGCLITLMGG